MAISKEKSQGERVYWLWIGSKVEEDYKRRGVLTDLCNAQSIYRNHNGRRFKVSRATLMAVAEDATEQRAIKRGRDGRSLATSYGVMSKNLLRDLGIDPHVIASGLTSERPSIGMPEYRAGTGRQPVAWSDCLWQPPK